MAKARKSFLNGYLLTRIFLGGLVIGALAVAFFIYQTKSLRLSFFDNMFVEEITYRFQSYATKISGKQSLQVARLEQREIYERTSRARFLNLKLPDVIVSAEFPVEYNFSVSFLIPWRFEKNNDELIVYVPELAAHTPAINISQLQFNVKKGSFIRNEAEAKERLRKELSGFVVDQSILLREKVRDQARSSVREFIRGWLSATTGAPFGQNIRVVFPNEKDSVKP